MECGKGTVASVVAVGAGETKDHIININQIRFRVVSPSHYQCIDHVGVSISYFPTYRIKLKSRKRNCPPKYKRMHRVWLVQDGRDRLPFVSLSEACMHLRQAIDYLISQDFNING